MNSLSDETLFLKLKILCKTERQTLSQILDHLQEVEKRKAYAKLGYSNIFKYLTRELGYSDGAAGRRMNALKLVKAMPESMKLIADGELNLSTVGKVNTLIDWEKQKGERVDTDLLNQFRGKTAAQCDQILGERGAPKPKRESRKYISKDEVRLSLNLTNKTHKQLERLKDHLRTSKTDQAIDFAVNLALHQIEKKMNKTNKSRGSHNRRVFSAATKKAALKRAGFCCQYDGCDETRYLEFDHLRAYALGGGNEIENCRVICRTHNFYAATQVFGHNHMNRFRK
jgi:hypothetical protein